MFTLDGILAIGATLLVVGLFLLFVGLGKLALLLFAVAGLCGWHAWRMVSDVEGPDDNNG